MPAGGERSAPIKTAGQLKYELLPLGEWNGRILVLHGHDQIRKTCSSDESSVMRFGAGGNMSTTSTG
jgi:hypothetical protein